MSTRSLIGLQQADGTVKAIYCHWDGYPEWNGEKLANFYPDEQHINKLLVLGDISSLGDKPEAPEAVQRFGFDYSFTDEFRSLDKDEQKRLKEDVYHKTTAYHRDRGEEWQQTRPRIYSSLHDFIDRGEEYNYVFIPEKGWYVNYSDYVLMSLKPLLTWGEKQKKVDCPVAGYCTALWETSSVQNLLKKDVTEETIVGALQRLNAINLPNDVKQSAESVLSRTDGMFLKEKISSTYGSFYLHGTSEQWPRIATLLRKINGAVQQQLDEQIPGLQSIIAE